MTNLSCLVLTSPLGQVRESVRPRGRLQAVAKSIGFLGRLGRMGEATRVTRECVSRLPALFVQNRRKLLFPCPFRPFRPFFFSFIAIFFLRSRRTSVVLSHCVNWHIFPCALLVLLTRRRHEGCRYSGAAGSTHGAGPDSAQDHAAAGRERRCCPHCRTCPAPHAPASHKQRDTERERHRHTHTHILAHRRPAAGEVYGRGASRCGGRSHAQTAAERRAGGRPADQGRTVCVDSWLAVLSVYVYVYMRDISNTQPCSFSDILCRACSLLGIAWPSSFSPPFIIIAVSPSPKS
jgi:hypothetical protein